MIEAGRTPLPANPDDPEVNSSNSWAVDGWRRPGGHRQRRGRAAARLRRRSASRSIPAPTPCSTMFEEIRELRDEAKRSASRR